MFERVRRLWGGSNTHQNISAQPPVNSLNANEGVPALSIGGNKAKVEVKNATFTNVGEGSINVGSPDGAGSLEIGEKGNVVQHGVSGSTFIGVYDSPDDIVTPGHMNAHATLKDRVQYNSTLVKDKSVLKITSGGEFETSKTIWIGYGDLIVSGKDARITNKGNNNEGEQLFTIASVDGQIPDALKDIELQLSFNGSTANTVAMSAGYVATKTIPEPTTATLSLLALAGLAARRRRH